MRTVSQYIDPAMPFSVKQGMFIKMSSDGNMPDHFYWFQIQCKYRLLNYNLIQNSQNK